MNVALAVAAVVAATTRGSAPASNDVGALLTAALAGGLISAVITSLTGAWSIAARDRRADERTLRDHRLVRLRGAFTPVLKVAELHYDVGTLVRQQPGETVDAWRYRWMDFTARQLVYVDDARVALQLETAPVGPEILDRFRNVREAFIEHQVTFEDRVTHGDGVPGLAEIRAMTADLRTAVDALQQLMVQALRDLERPLPRPWRERLHWPWWGQG